MKWFKDSCLYPYKYAFCPDEKVWNRVVPKIIGQPYAYPKAKAACCTSFHHYNGQNYSLVTISISGSSRAQIVGLLAHEAYHVVCNICEVQEDTKPSEEFVASAIQRVTMDLLWQYEEARGKLK